MVLSCWRKSERAARGLVTETAGSLQTAVCTDEVGAASEHARQSKTGYSFSHKFRTCANAWHLNLRQQHCRRRWPEGTISLVIRSN